MKECDKPNSHISSKFHMFYISSDNDRHPVTKTFTTLHYPLIWLHDKHLCFVMILAARVTVL